METKRIIVTEENKLECIKKLKDEGFVFKLYFFPWDEDKNYSLYFYKSISNDKLYESFAQKDNTRLIDKINNDHTEARYLNSPPFLYRNEFRRCNCQKCWCDFGDYVDNEIQLAAESGNSDEKHIKEVSDAWDAFEKEYPQCLECIAEHFDTQTIQDMLDKKPCIILEELIKIMDSHGYAKESTVEEFESIRSKYEDEKDSKESDFEDDMPF